MSWLVEDYIMSMNTVKEASDFESQAYDEIIAIEMAIDVLSSLHILTDKELKVINLLKEGNLYADVARKLGLARQTVPIVFRKACNKIAIHLGKEFTDEGFKAKMINKYNLSSSEIKKMDKYMNSRFKHRLKRS